MYIYIYIYEYLFVHLEKHIPITFGYGGSGRYNQPTHVLEGISLYGRQGHGLPLRAVGRHGAQNWEVVAAMRLVSHQCWFRFTLDAISTLVGLACCEGRNRGKYAMKLSQKVEKRRIRGIHVNPSCNNGPGSRICHGFCMSRAGDKSHHLVRPAATPLRFGWAQVQCFFAHWSCTKTFQDVLRLRILISIRFCMEFGQTIQSSKMNSASNLFEYEQLWYFEASSGEHHVGLKHPPRYTPIEECKIHTYIYIYLIYFAVFFGWTFQLYECLYRH